VLVARSSDGLAAVSEEIHAINKSIEVLAVPTDMSNPASISSLWDEVKTKFGHADVLINNAGTSQNGSILDIPEDSWWSDFVSNQSHLVHQSLTTNRRSMSEELFLPQRDF
jgi:short-subunit dehydrogenase